MKAEGVDVSCSTNIAYHGTTTFKRDEIFRQVYLYVILKYDTCPLVKPEITDLQSLTN